MTLSGYRSQFLSAGAGATSQDILIIPFFCARYSAACNAEEIKGVSSTCPLTPVLSSSRITPGGWGDPNGFSLSLPTLLSPLSLPLSPSRALQTLTCTKLFFPFLCISIIIAISMPLCPSSFLTFLRFSSLKVATTALLTPPFPPSPLSVWTRGSIRLSERQGVSSFVVLCAPRLTLPGLKYNYLYCESSARRSQGTCVCSCFRSRVALVVIAGALVYGSVFGVHGD